MGGILGISEGGNNKLYLQVTKVNQNRFYKTYVEITGIIQHFYYK